MTLESILDFALFYADPFCPMQPEFQASQGTGTCFGILINRYSRKLGNPMTTSNFSTHTIGWMAIATGVSAILAVVFLTLMYTVNGPFFGTLNDVFNSMIGISSVILAWMVYAEYHSGAPMLAQSALLLALLGAIFTLIGSVLIIFGFTGFVLAGWYTGIGNALIGLWLAVLCYSLLNGAALPHHLVIFGLIVGVCMAMGLIGIPGILARIDNMQAMPWYLYIAGFGYLGTYLLYPIWMIWFGRVLVK
jgi:hypothetical protein